MIIATLQYSITPILLLQCVVLPNFLLGHKNASPAVSIRLYARFATLMAARFSSHAGKAHGSGMWTEVNTSITSAVGDRRFSGMRRKLWLKRFARLRRTV